MVWVACTAYSDPRTTSNGAEYFGLLHWLRYAKLIGCVLLPVIGDSMMIIHQQRRPVTPRAAGLAILFRQTRRMADTMLIAGWDHHYRAQNKMADKAANIAMDTRVSAQFELPSDRTAATEIQVLLSNDIGSWMEKSLTTES